MAGKDYKGKFMLPEGMPFDDGVVGDGGVTGEVRKLGDV